MPDLPPARCLHCGEEIALGVARVVDGDKTRLYCLKLECWEEWRKDFNKTPKVPFVRPNNHAAAV